MHGAFRVRRDENQAMAGRLRIHRYGGKSNIGGAKRFGKTLTQRVIADFADKASRRAKRRHAGNGIGNRAAGQALFNAYLFL